MASRIIVRVELTPSVKKALDQLSEKAGMTQLSMVSRIVDWLARQPASVQAAIWGMGHSPGDASPATLMLKHMASGKKG